MPRPRSCDLRRQIACLDDVLAVVATDHVARPEPRYRRRTSGLHRGNERAHWLLEPERRGQFLIEILDANAEPAARHFAIGLKLLCHLHRHIYRDGEGYALVAAAATIDLCVDTHHPARLVCRCAGHPGHCSQPRPVMAWPTAIRNTQCGTVVARVLKTTRDKIRFRIDKQGIRADE